ncbi:beta-L-arabinofuranosidase domain-containing protein, partial [Rhizobium johnstonii]
CASVGLVFWASRMLGRGPYRRYADIMEQALYNGALPGLSTDGKTFFYDNPLESAGKHHRLKWHHCPCCPPNIAAVAACLGGEEMRFGAAFVDEIFRQVEIFFLTGH